MQGLLALAATVASAAFAVSVLRQWSRRGRSYQLAWGVSLAMFAAASAALAVGVSFGWTRATFDVYYLFGALLTVPVLAIGTMELLAGRTLARAYLVLVAVFAVASVALLAAAPIGAADLAGELPEGSQVLPVAVRALAAIGNGVGTLIIVGGALVTVARAARGDRSGWFRQRRVQGTVLIAAGVLLAAAARRTPVVLDGPATAAAALVAARLSFRAPDWWLAGTLSPDPAHQIALTRLSLEPVLDLGLRGEDGTGALLAVPVLRAAVSA